jgi:hypothetical protein
MPKEKKIRQDVLRTLEMVYERSSYPSDDVIRFGPAPGPA